MNVSRGPVPASGPFLSALFVIVAIGCLVRAWGTDFGLPFLYHADEAEIVDRALRMPADGPNPHWFRYPTLYIYTQAGLYTLLYAGQRALGRVSDYAEFLQWVGRDPTTIYQAGRLVTAGLGTAAVAVIGLAGLQLRSMGIDNARWIGVTAAALLCANYIHVEHSHFISTDVPLSFLASCLILQMGFIAQRADGGLRRHFAVAGFLVGLGASLKYPGALLAILIVIVHARSLLEMTWRARLRDSRLPVAAASSVAGFVVGSPFVVLAAGEFARDLSAETQHMRSGHLGFETIENGWATYLEEIYGSGGLALLVFFCIGGLGAAWKRDVCVRALAITTLALFAVAGTSNVLFTRYLLPLVPAACLVAAFGLVFMAGSLPRRASTLKVPVLVTLLIGSCALPGFLIYHRLRLFTAADTRTLAWHWAVGTLAPNSTPALLAVERNSIPLKPAPLPSVRTVPVVYDRSWLAGSGVKYVAVSDRLYRRFLRARSRYPAETAFYDELLARGSLVEVFTPFANDAGRLMRAADGSPAISPAMGGPLWKTLPPRRLAGPVVLVFEVPLADAPGSLDLAAGQIEAPVERPDDDPE